MDPEARVVVTAKDVTAAAFASADRNLKQFQRSLTGIRQIAGTFGVVFSARAFLGWINGALKAAEATGEHEEAVKAAKETLESMKSASDALALSIGTSLVPAMQALTAVFTGWNRIISGADPFAFEARINDLTQQITIMEAQLASSGGMSQKWRDEFSASIDAVRKKLDEAKLAQERALGVGLGGIGIRKPTQLISDDEVQMINDLIAELNTPKARPPLITEEELVALETFIHDMNEREPFITLEERIALEEFINELNSVPERLTQEEWIDLESFIYDLNHMEDEAKEAAAAMGEDFRNAFSGWIMGAERSFKDLLERMAVEMATSALFKGFASLFPGGSFFSNFFGGARANGGPVSGGKAYLVGERGPELFVPGQSGMIAANGAGGLVYNDNSVFNFSGSRDDAPAFRAMLDAHKREVMAEIKDKQRRGRF